MWHLVFSLLRALQFRIEVSIILFVNICSKKGNTDLKERIDFQGLYPKTAKICDISMYLLFFQSNQCVFLCVYVSIENIN